MFNGLTRLEKIVSNYFFVIFVVKVIFINKKVMFLYFNIIHDKFVSSNMLILYIIYFSLLTLIIISF